MQTRSAALGRLIFVDLLGSVIWFPVWWYTKGLILVAKKFLDIMRYRSRSYGFKIWIRNFFVPMYGQNDLTGKLVSVFMRFVVLIAKCVAYAVEGLAYILGLLLWMATPALLILLALASFAAGTFLKSV